MSAGLVGIEHFLYVEDLEPLVYVFTLAVAIVLVYGFSRYSRRWFGKAFYLPKPNRIAERLGRLFSHSLLQAKVLQKMFEGAIHALIFYGMLLLFIATFLRGIEFEITLRLFDERFLVDGVYRAFKLMAVSGGLMALAGIVLAFYRRARGLTTGLPQSREDYAVLLLLGVILVTGFILDAINTIAYRREWIGYWDPIGMYLSGLFQGMDEDALRQLYRGLWLFHLGIAMTGIALLPFTKLSHIVVSGILNIFYSRLEHPSAFKPVDNLEKAVETGELGIVKLSHTTWKQRMDYDACTKCARCHNACPANISGKPLSPMRMVLDMRQAMDRGDWDKDIEAIMEPDIFWSCVMCGACVYECPVDIHHVETILDARRGLYAKGGNVPEGLLQLSYNIMRTGNAYGMNPVDREEWIRSLEERGLAEVAREGEEYDVLYWTGCNVSYDPNLRGVGESLLKLLKTAGLRVAVLAEEQCCGEPVRRAGDELMFAEVAKTNYEALKRYKFKKLLVNCPHGYNVFKHEYPLYGYELDVVHHTLLLDQLVKEGRLPKPVANAYKDVTYHDPCYLGRWNGHFEEPRNLLRNVKGLRLKEMPRNRERSFCCGAGGAHGFFELKKGKRISRIRAEEAASTGAKVVAVACPFCNAMFRSEASDLGFEVKDIAEILAQGLEEKGVEKLPKNGG